MRAACRDRYGPPDVIRVVDVEDPVPSGDQIRVRLEASTVSRTDHALLTGRPAVMRLFAGLRVPRQRVLGTDFAGHVDAVGPRVDRFAVGDRVWGIRDMGAASHAECLVIAAGAAVEPMPADLDPAAVACVEGGWYAYSMLERVAVGRGSRVLINGATGAIGSALLQLCVHRGASVTAVGGTKNLELLRSLGAERTIDYEHADFTTDGQVFDAVFDAVGKSTFGACRHLLTPKGVYASTEPGPGGQNIFLAVATVRGRGKRVVFPIPVHPRRFLQVLGGLLRDGHLRPVIDQVVGLDAIQEAYRYVGSGQKTGSVVLKLGTRGASDSKHAAEAS